MAIITIALLLSGLALLLLGGASAPELMVNILGSIRGETDLAIGNVVGSNLANLGLVLGIAAIVRPMGIQGQVIRRELPLLMLVTSILAVMTLDRVLQNESPSISRSDGLILLLLFSIFVAVYLLYLLDRVLA